MRLTIIVISLAVGILIFNLFPTAAQTPFEFTNTSGMGLDDNGTFNVGIEARGSDAGKKEASTADLTRELTFLPRKVWIKQGSVTLVPQEPSFSFWSGLHFQPEAALLRMYFISDTGNIITFLNEILNASVVPANLAVAPYEIDLPQANHWQLKAHIEVSGGGKFVDSEIELAGNWQ